MNSKLNTYKQLNAVKQYLNVTEIAREMNIEPATFRNRIEKGLDITLRESIELTKIINKIKGELTDVTNN